VAEGNSKQRHGVPDSRTGVRSAGGVDGGPSQAQRAASGKAARAKAPLASHAEFAAGADRDPIGLLLSQAESRVPELVPVRHGRMLASPFTYYRGAALPMAADLAQSPTSGLRVQLCGDAHLANFGAYASPERRLVFDVNDFDETLPGPFEWDVKRLAASMEVAGRDNGYARKDRRRIVLAAVAGYRKAMRDFAGQPLSAVWYAHLNAEDAVAQLKSKKTKERYKANAKLIAHAHSRDSTQALKKLTTIVDGQRRIISNPPLIVPVEEVFSEIAADELYEWVRGLIGKYRRSLQTDRRHLLAQYTLVQAARKVVGVGSVGTRAWILLMVAGDDEPLVLQAKEAQTSVLSDYVGKSRFTNQGERVVAGQRLMQASSDIFLGWQRTPSPDGTDRDYYLRQLRDWKASAEIEQMVPESMALYGRLCGRTLARAHARSGDRVAIGSYLGKSDAFDNAVADFSASYADQNEHDHAALQEAVDTGRTQAQTGL